MRLFLSEAGYRRALEPERREIRIKRTAHISEGHILVRQEKEQETLICHSFEVTAAFFHAQNWKGVKQMAVFRVQRTRDYTVMSNYHLRDQNLTLKAKGLLSMMLSLPDEWNYTTRGWPPSAKRAWMLSVLPLKELENTGYIVRHQLRDANGRISDTEYIIYEQPHKAETPDTDSPDTENPDMDTPYLEKPAELNIEELNTQKSITDGSNTDSIPFRGYAAEARRNRNEGKRRP